MYTVKNYRSKKELKADVAMGKRVEYYQPGPFGGNEPMDGVIFLEGPHNPEPHRWYAQAWVAGGAIVKVK